VELKVSHEKGFNIPEKEPNKLFRNSVRSLYALSRRGFTKDIEAFFMADFEFHQYLYFNQYECQ